MADPKRDLIDGDLSSSRNGNDTSLSQIYSEQIHQPISDYESKGKAPVWTNQHDRIHPDDGQVSNEGQHGEIHTTNAQIITESLDEIKLSAAPVASGATREGLDESSLEDRIRHEIKSPEPNPQTSNVEPEDETHGHGATTPKPSPNSKHKQKQKAEPERKSEPGPANPAPTTAGQSTSEGTDAQTFRPLQCGQPGWEKSADRPPKKLPIRFKDAVGRKFLFPWEKANTWAGMSRLIRNCFLHVDIIGPHVNEGHYDLIASLPFSMSTDVTLGMGSQPEPQSQSPTLPAAGTPDSQITGTSNEPSLPQAPTPPPAAPSSPVQQNAAVIILPELWEDLIEPGMFVSMHMWPMDHPQPPPPPPPHYLQPSGPPMFPGFPGGRGRGRGRGMGRGMTMAPPFRPPGWNIEINRPKPRGKTRKRPEGL
ncbi:hypothetical protein F4804DRAFT_298653 [Jackrogersella minutella]|nr:hypothetical protein F4804DRAFT_298653 [Jackrogersella minutella]